MGRCLYVYIYWLHYVSIAEHSLFSSCRSRSYSAAVASSVAEHKLWGTPASAVVAHTWTQLSPRHVGPGIEPLSLAWKGLLITGPPGKPGEGFPAAGSLLEPLPLSSCVPQPVPGPPSLFPVYGSLQALPSNSGGYFHLSRGAFIFQGALPPGEALLLGCLSGVPSLCIHLLAGVCPPVCCGTSPTPECCGSSSHRHELGL